MYEVFSTLLQQLRPQPRSNFHTGCPRIIARYELRLNEKDEKKIAAYYIEQNHRFVPTNVGTKESFKQTIFLYVFID
jgi:hypothetical protein